MKLHQLLTTLLLTVSLQAADKALPDDILKIMQQPKYEHAIWGLYVKDLQTGEILYEQNANKLFSPASTTKLFSVAALLHTYGDDYRFKTPVYASGKIDNGKLDGNLILVAQGDLTLGGRQSDPDKISYTKMDHIIANAVPGVILTQEDPLKGFNQLAKQVAEKGIKEIHGDVIIDHSLFETHEARDMILTPIMVNENLIDIVINPAEIGQAALLTWRPVVPGYKVENRLNTVSKDGALEINITADDAGRNIVVEGTVPAGQKDIIRTFAIKDPVAFARAAFIQALQQQGIQVNIAENKALQEQPLSTFKDLQEVALWTSPPLSEYGKLILKVSHNLGADLVPLLLAAHAGKKTYDEGMQLLGDFAVQEVKLTPDEIVFNDAAGGNENRLTPQGEVQLLEYMQKNQQAANFKLYFDALPILGVDGSLQDFAKNTPAVGKVRAKTGTGLSYNLATKNFFLITQALAGYIEGKNGHLYAYSLIVNNGSLRVLDDIFPVFEDESQISALIYNQT